MSTKVFNTDHLSFPALWAGTQLRGKGNILSFLPNIFPLLIEEPRIPPPQARSFLTTLTAAHASSVYTQLLCALSLLLIQPWDACPRAQRWGQCPVHLLANQRIWLHNGWRAVTSTMKSAESHHFLTASRSPLHLWSSDINSDGWHGSGEVRQDFLLPKQKPTTVKAPPVSR